MARAAAKRRRKRISAVITLILLLCALGILRYMLSRPIPVTQFSSVHERNAMAADAEIKARRFIVQDRHPARTSPILEVDEREVNAYIQSSAKVQSQLQAKGISNPSVSLQDGQLTATADVPVSGVTMPITISGKFVSTPGQEPAFQIESIKVGRMGVPQALTKEASDKLLRMAGSGGLKLPPQVSDVKIQNGRITVIGK